MPLQGSLFGDFQGNTTNENPQQKSNSSTNEDFSNAELTKSSESRPRIRKDAKKKKDLTLLEETIPVSKEPARYSHHSQVNKNQLTPVLRHYVELKEESPQRILLYRLGDFFECFFEDAILLSQILELTLTGKEAGKTLGRIPMAGIPHHAAERYCAELIKRGLSVALCDQLETTPKKGNLLKRGITRILTPGTILEEGMLQARRNNWLSAVVIAGAYSTVKSNPLTEFE